MEKCFVCGNPPEGYAEEFHVNGVPLPICTRCLGDANRISAQEWAEGLRRIILSRHRMEF